VNGKFLQILLIANTLFELGVGIVMIFFPAVLFQGDALPQSTMAIARILGCNAFALASLSWFMRGLTELRQLRVGLIALTVFHVTVSIAQFFNFLAGSPIPVVIVHSLFAVAFVLFLRQSIKE
jgi:hypothetical protein